MFWLTHLLDKRYIVSKPSGWTKWHRTLRWCHKARSRSLKYLVLRGVRTAPEFFFFRSRNTLAKCEEVWAHIIKSCNTVQTTLDHRTNTQTKTKTKTITPLLFDIHTDPSTHQTVDQGSILHTHIPTNQPRNHKATHFSPTSQTESIFNCGYPKTTRSHRTSPRKSRRITRCIRQSSKNRSSHLLKQICFSSQPWPP